MSCYRLIPIVLLSFCSLHLLGQETVRRESTTIRGLRLDTNKVVYDESGNALRYYQYNKLINTGEYSIRSGGDPRDPTTKHFLKKLSLQEQMSAAERISSALAVKSPVLKPGMLNNLPFYEVFDKNEFDQKVKVLIFWSAGCPPCTESFESVNEIFRQIYNPQEVISLAITRDSREKASAKLKEKPLLYAKLISNGSSIYNAYNLNSMPTFIIADKNDVIQFAATGIAPQMMIAFKSHLRALLNQ
jgi:protein-disulfide isomerase